MSKETRYVRNSLLVWTYWITGLNAKKKRFLKGQRYMSLMYFYKRVGLGLTTFRLKENPMAFIA